MQKRLAIGQGVRILDQKKKINERGRGSTKAPPASLRINVFKILMVRVVN